MVESISWTSDLHWVPSGSIDGLIRAAMLMGVCGRRWGLLAQHSSLLLAHPTTSTVSDGKVPGYGCWNEFLGSGWVCLYPGCHGNKMKLPDKFWFPVNAQLDQKHSVSSLQSPNVKPTLGFLNTNKANRQPVRVFLSVFSLSFILYPIKPSCCLPHFAVLQKEAVRFMKC